MVTQLTDFPIVYVDDDRANLVTLRYALGELFDVRTTTSPDEALRLLADEEVAVLISDQRMPGMTGVELCERARLIRPETVRIILTAYADVHAAIDAINRGAVSRYLLKPWRDDEMVDLLRNTVELVAAQRTIRDLQTRMLSAAPSAGAEVALAELAHELSNPLQGLTVTLQVASDLLVAIEREESASERVRELARDGQEAVRDATAASDQLMGIVRRLRDTRRSRPSTPATEVSSDVARVVESAVRIVRNEVQRVADLSVVVLDEPTARIDATSLSQVVINLVLNATQALEDTPRSDARVEVRVSAERGMACVRVRDNGPGVPPEAEERIFDAFYTTKESGSGIGLAVVRELVQRAGGEVRLEPSATNEGATFAVWVPLAPAGSPSRGPRAA
jgi:signal transduction histidine kinase